MTSPAAAAAMPLVTSSSNLDNDSNSINSNKKRRFCRVEGCSRIVKSQGLCQGHGAKPRGCKVTGCPKQAQGNFDGMCSK